MISRALVHDVAAAQKRGCQVVDVRTPDEFANGHIPGAQSMPLFAVPLRIDELDRRRPVYVVCESGARSQQAGAYLDGRGYRVFSLDGGMASWRAAGLPTAAGTSTVR